MKRGVVNELPFPSPPLVCVTGSSSSSQGVVNKFLPFLSFDDCRLENFLCDKEKRKPATCTKKM